MQALLMQVAVAAIASGMSLDEFENVSRRQFVISVLEVNNYNQCKTAKVLGIHRNTLWRTLQALGVNVHQLRSQRLLFKKPVASAGEPSRIAPRAKIY